MNLLRTFKFESLYFLSYAFVAIWKSLNVFYNNFVQGVSHTDTYGQYNLAWIWAARDGKG